MSSNTRIDFKPFIPFVVVGGIWILFTALFVCAKRKRQLQGVANTDTHQVELQSIDRWLASISEKPIKFTSFQLESFTKNYSENIGSGGFGVVYKGQLPNGQLPNGIPVAVKVLNSRAKEQFKAEVGTIGRIHHFHLVRLYGYCFEPKVKALVYEYMENGSLQQHLFSNEKKIGFDKLYEIAIGTAKGIRYLHEDCKQRIVHYDIKPGNVLLTADFSPKVADFGLAQFCDREETHFTMAGGRGTPGYAAPELWTCLPVTYKCDVYSFGMLLFEIMGRRQNFESKLQSQDQWYPRFVWQKFEIGQIDTVFTVAGIEEMYREKAKRMCNVALWCVQQRPDERPTMSDVVRMLEGEQEIRDPTDPFRQMSQYIPKSIATSGTGTSTT